MLKLLKMLAGHVVSFVLLVIGGIFGVITYLLVKDLGGVFALVNLGSGKLISISFVLGLGMTGIGLGGGLLYYLWTVVWPADARTMGELRGESDEPESSSALRQLRKGSMLDYEVRTWTVTEHTKYPYEGWPADTWTLEHDGKERLLEYEREDGGTFRLYEKVPVSTVTVDGESFRSAVGAATVGSGAPSKIKFEEMGDTTYVLAEEDVRVHDRARTRSGEADRINFLTRSRTYAVYKGVCGGIAQYLNVPAWLVRLVFVLVGLAGWCGILLFLVYLQFGLAVPKPPPERLSHYWVYEDEEGKIITLQCARGSWTAHAGREVEPYEFDNILPPSQT